MKKRDPWLSDEMQYIIGRFALSPFDARILFDSGQPPSWEAVRLIAERPVFQEALERIQKLRHSQEDK